MTTLYNLSVQYEQVLDIENLDEQTLKDTLDSIDSAIEVKVENIAKVMQESLAQDEVIQKEIDRLTARKASNKKGREWLNKYVADIMDRLGKDEIKTDLFTAKFKKNPPALNVIDESKIPEKYFVIIPPVPQSLALDKKAVKDALKDGLKIEGAEITVGRRLEIK